MSAITLYNPHPKQKAAHTAPERYKVLNWGRQTGKSFFAINYTLVKALQKQGRYWIVAPTYRQAKDIYWKQYVSMLPKELIEKTNENELTITLKYIEDDKLGIKHDVNRPPSTIELKGCDDADKLRGARVDGFVFDEFAFATEGISKWELVFEPMLLTTQGWAVFISTPNGFNFFYELANRAQTQPGWFYSHATPYDNPAVTNADIERIKRERTEDNFYQEYMAEFRKMEGLVYREFDRQSHMVDPNDVPKDGTNIVGIDFGFTNPFAAAFIRIDYDDNWWIYDEVYKSQLTTDQAIQIVRDKMTGTHITAMVGDPAAAEHIANFNSKGLPIIPAKKGKDSIKLGIGMVSEKLKLREQMQGKPKPKLFVASNCENFIKEIESYSYPKGTDTRNPKEEPVKKDDHLMDAVRYAVMTYQAGLQREYKFPDEGLFDNGGFYDF